MKHHNVYQRPTRFISTEIILIGYFVNIILDFEWGKCDLHVST